MEPTTTTQPTVIRTERGLTIAGIRITLYDVMDYLPAAWPPRLICGRLDLSDQQIADVMEYIQNHRAAVEAEYQHVLQTAEENRRYWEERNQEWFARRGGIAALSGVGGAPCPAQCVESADRE